MEDGQGKSATYTLHELAGALGVGLADFYRESLAAHLRAASAPCSSELSAHKIRVREITGRAFEADHDQPDAMPHPLFSVVLYHVLAQNEAGIKEWGMHKGFMRSAVLALWFTGGSAFADPGQISCVTKVESVNVHSPGVVYATFAEAGVAMLCDLKADLATSRGIVTPEICQALFVSLNRAKAESEDVTLKTSADEGDSSSCDLKWNWALPDPYPEISFAIE